MPLVVILLIGILAFGLFDLTLGRPLPVSAVLPPIPAALKSEPQTVDMPSMRTAATSQTASCDAHDTACQLLALYHFVVTTVSPQHKQSPWLHVQQHPARTLVMKSGDSLDIAILFSSLLDQQHIRNYVIVLPEDSYVLACDITPAALHHAGGNWPPATPLLDPNLVAATEDSTTLHARERLDAYAVNVGDAPCPCLLLDPSGPISQEPGAPLPLAPGTLRSALDLRGQPHPVVVSPL